MSDRKRKKNPRYAHIGPTIDTGASMTKYEARMKRKQAEAPKQGELFRRIKAANLVRLMQEDQLLAMEVSRQVDSDSFYRAPAEPEFEVHDGPGSSPVGSPVGSPVAGGSPPSGFRERPLLADSSSARFQPVVRRQYQQRGSTASSVEGGAGGSNALLTGAYGQQETAEPPRRGRGGVYDDYDMHSVATTAHMGGSPGSPVTSFLEGGLPEYENRYLLLDIRTPEEYERCHIDGAINFPSARLSRSCNVFTRVVRSYKNKPNAVVVVYDDDERVAPRTANVFFERGFDNIVMLVGGLKGMVANYPSFVLADNDDIPKHLLPPPEPKHPRHPRRRTRPGTADTTTTTTTSASHRTLDTSYRSTASARSTSSRMSDISRLPGYNARTKGKISAWH